MQDITLKKISYKNWKGIPDLSIQPGSVTIVTGTNGAGKTSIIDGLRYCVRTGKKFHDPSVIGPCGEFALLTIEFSDGYLLKVKVKPKETDRKVSDEKGHEVTRAAEHIEAICNALSVDPMSFLALDDDKRLAAILEAIDLRVTSQELGFVPTRILTSSSLDRHALIVLGELDKAMREDRTGQGRILKEKEATVKQLTETLPEEPAEGNWDQELGRVTAEFKTLQAGTKQRILGVEADTRAASESARDLAQAKKDFVNEELQAAIQRLRETAAVKIDEADRQRQDAIAIIDENRKQALASIDAESQPQYRALNEQIARAKAMAESHAAAEKTRQFIADQKSGAEKAKVSFDVLTEAIGKLETLKNRLASDVPIKGLEIRDGEIYVTGVLWRQVNDARKLEVAIDYSILKAGSAKFLVADNLEKLDSFHKAHFFQILKSKGMQVIGAMVSDEELAISNTDPPEVLGGQLKVTKVTGKKPTVEPADEVPTF